MRINSLPGMPFLGFLAGGCDVEECPPRAEEVQEESVGKRARAKKTGLEDAMGRTGHSNTWRGWQMETCPKK